MTVVDLSKSPYAALHPAPLTAVDVDDPFWSPRLKRNREQTIPGQLKQCESTGRIDNFRRASGRKEVPFQGIFFNDSDVYKWAEAASNSLATHPDPGLDAELDAVIDEISAAQEPDGYLNTYFMFERKPERFKNLKDMHEMYCAGHLIQAAVAHHRATGKTTFLDVACRLADHLDSLFGEGEGKRVGACGHEEAEMALVELYRETGEGRYLALARAMIDARGRTPGIFQNSKYHQDHLPFPQQTEFVGHAVRCMYLACGAADVYAETGDAGYRHGLDALWSDFTERKMYVSGGAGARYEGEAFGASYELPNDRAYAETCAAIGSFMWNWRLLNIHGESRFADLMELTLYNAILPGLSLSGLEYFYENPLADRGGHRRQEWFGCACCPPNVARLLAALPGYLYSTSAEGIFVHQYISGAAKLETQAGSVTLTQRTGYPWDGDIHFVVDSAPEEGATLNLRIPGWARGEFAVRLNATDLDPAALDTDSGYLRLAVHRSDRVHLSLQTSITEVHRLQAHPHVLDDWGRVALQRGPLIYCIEQIDNPGVDVWEVMLPDSAIFRADHRSDLLDGVTVLSAEALALESDAGHRPLYRDARPCETKPARITAVPYYAWANREAGPMQVWIPRFAG